MSFQRLGALIGQDNLQLLSKKTVLIAGLGGVGSYACEALARSGIGTFILVDSDTLDETNLNRQIHALHSTIGRLKVDVMAERIVDINPQATVIKYPFFIDASTIDSLWFQPVDMVIDAIDTMPSKVLLIEASQRLEIPLISSMGFANKLNPEAIRISTLAKTHTDPVAKTMRRLLREKNLSLTIPVVFSSENPKPSLDYEVKLGSCAFVPSVAGLLMSAYVVQSFIKKETI